MASYTRHRRRIITLVALMAMLAGGVLFLCLFPINAALYTSAPASGEMLDRNGQLLFATLNPQEQWCFPRPLSGISPYLQKATIAAEDRRFRFHPGVDPLAIMRAFVQNLRGARTYSGASTLTMQLTKMAQPRTRGLRAWWNKAAQAALALRLEGSLAKDDILNAYLNRAPYGRNLGGAEAAARRYFGKNAGELTLSEAALLAGLPAAPSAYDPLRHANRARVRRDYVLGRMLDDGLIARLEYEEAIAQPVGASWNALPMYAPHLADRYAVRLRGGARVRTTLDAAIQKRVEHIIRRGLLRFNGTITNAAAILADTASGEILARVGSPGYFSPTAGQFDACAASRSPGSALKPFIYALAIEKSLLYPSEMLLDAPVDYGNYRPENFEQGFSGLIPAWAALRTSLNIPALTVINRLSQQELHDFLRKSGLSSLKMATEHYGLGLVLGGCEVKLEELAGAYATLANLGERIPLHTEFDPPVSRSRLLQPGTCLAAYEMLEQTLPDTTDTELAPMRAEERLCWKTGTSANNRDAWVFVFNQHHVLGLWLGNADGKSSPDLVGTRAALPIAARIWRALPPSARGVPAWPDSSLGLREVTVCTKTGLPADEACSDTQKVRMPRESLVLRKCAVHVMESGRVTARWPSSPARWDLSMAQPTVRADGAPEGVRAEALQILAPSAGATYVLTGEPDGDKLRLRSSLDETQPVHWYADGTFLGTATTDTPVSVALTLGKHSVACMTDKGTRDTAEYEVIPPDSESREMRERR